MCVLFTGPPGVGKTSCIQQISEGIVHLSSDGKEIYKDEMTYCYNCYDKYWQGYAQNKFCRMDDVFALNSMEIRAQEAGTVIGMINTNPMPLNMATLADKGNCNFNSEYVFLSTNIANNGYRLANWQLGLTDPGALLRRFHLILHKETKFDTEHRERNLYRIDKAPTKYAHLEGTYIGFYDITQLVYTIRQDHERSGMNTRMTSEQMAEIYAEKKDFSKPPDENRERLFPGRQEFAAESGIDAIGTYARYVRLGLYDFFCDAELNTPSDLDYGNRMRRKFASFLFLIVAIASATTLMNFFYSQVPQKENFEPESHEKKVRKRPVKHNKHNKERNRFKPRTFATEAEFTPEFEDNYHKAIISLSDGVCQINVKHFDIDGNFIGNMSGVAFHMKDGIMLTAKHTFINPHSDKRSVKLQIDVYSGREPPTTNVAFYGKIIGKATEADVSMHETEDTAAVRVKFSETPKALYSYLPLSEEYPEVPVGYELTLVEGHRFGNKYRNMRFAEVEDVEYKVGGVNFIVNQVFGYYEPTGSGLSGAPLIIPGLQGRPILLGMHLGRDQGMGVAAQICKEYVDCFIGIEEEQSDFVYECAAFPLIIDHEVDISLGAFSPMKSKIKKSELYGCFGPPEYIPAFLRPFERDGVVIDPYLKALGKLHQQFTPATEIPEVVIEKLLSLYPPQEGVWKKILNFDEALNGTPYGLLPISASTSAGYPWCLKTTKGKAPHITFSEGKYNYGSEFYEYVKMCNERLLKGEQIEVIWKDSLKDETRLLS